MIDVGITVYLDDNIMSIIEFGWLYQSWIYTGCYEMSDIIVFHNPKLKKELLPKHENIIYAPLVPLSETDEEWAYYPHINGTWFLTTKEATFITKYKYILRTDPDCFLTSNFKNLRPRLALFGLSAFTKRPDVTEKLLRISTDWGIDQYYINIGGTIMTFSDDVINFSNLQLEYCEKLRDEEFKEGFGEWPGWYKRVINMYAGQLAANAVFSNNMILGGLDVFCMSDDEICPQDYHIHAWQTWNYFSKMRWHKGEYDNVDCDKLNKNIISDYCMWIAGKRVIK